MTHIATDLGSLERLAFALRTVKDGGERIVIDEEGREVAALIPIEDLRLLERLIEEEEDRIDIAAAEKARQEPGFVTLEEIEAKYRR